MTAGQVLFRIDDADYKARVEQARAEVEARRAAFDAAKTQQQLQCSLIAQMEADVRSSRPTASAPEPISIATRSSLARGAPPSAARQRAGGRHQGCGGACFGQGEARRRARPRALLDAQEAGALAALNQAQATLKLAEIDLANTVVRAAIAGIVGNWQVRVGRYVQPGMQLLAIVPLADAYVVANYKETQLDHMQVGQRVEMEVDSFPGRTFAGRVSSLSPASGAQFALLPPDNATGNFTKVVQRIPVKILIDPDGPLAGELRPGMSVIARVDTRPAAPRRSHSASHADLRA